MMEKQYRLDPACSQSFHNRTDFCIGTGRMGLALHQEYMDELRLTQKEIGFRHIRGHGLFCDDMAIYHTYQDANGETHAEYNFTYLDRVMDGYRSVGLSPFLELGFMPEKMASGDQTVFYWKGNVTPPRSYEDWKAMVQALLRHLLDRYGADVLTWPIEVWNEPNLPGFWKGADMPEYFRLFEETFRAIKEVDGRFTVGGPAICGVDDERWLTEFLKFCREKKIPLDFVTRHFYTFDTPEESGHYSYATLRRPEESLKELEVSRGIIDSFEEYRGIPMHITEFNTSYRPDSPIHDTTRNAAYIARLLASLGDWNDSYSYWTFGDVFEEGGVPFTPFHGGFGLVANGCIPKPTFWTFAFFKKLQGGCALRAEDAVAVRRADGSYAGVAWNVTMDEADGPKTLSFTLPEAGGSWCLLTKTVDETHANPLKVWHDLGEPSCLTEDQKELLRSAASPFVQTRRLSGGEALTFSLELAENALVYFELTPVSGESDRGYSYERATAKQ